MLIRKIQEEEGVDPERDKDRRFLRMREGIGCWAR